MVGIVVFEDHVQSAGGGEWCRMHALEPVANRPIALHVVDALLAAGVSEIIAVSSKDRAGEIRDCLTAELPSGCPPVHVITAPAPVDLLGALARAAEEVADAPCLVHLATGLLSGPLAPLVASLGGQPADLAMVVTKRGPSVVAATSAALVHTGPPGAETRGEPAGVLAFAPEALQHAVQFAPGCARATAVATIAAAVEAAGGDLRPHLGERWVSYTGDTGDLLTLNRITLERMDPALASPGQTGNVIEGRVWMHDTARVQSSIIVGPVTIAREARIRDAYIGPYTSIGPGAHVEGAEVERSIVSAGASIKHVGDRLVASVVGRDARVFKDFSIPRAMRLRVGAGGEVALC